MSAATFLVFGDLHGRVLPAYRLALAWGREHGEPVDGLLQVGDLGYFPDISRLDKATKRHAERDPLELGVLEVTEPSRMADAVFDEPDLPRCLWFTAGNHEDHERLDSLSSANANADSFVVDHYCQVRGIHDGGVATLPGGLRVGALWGIDDRAPNARRRTPPRGRIRDRSATRLACARFDVLLTHDGPRDAVAPDTGSEDITRVIGMAQPAFAFFGHYGGEGRRIEGDFGRTEVYLLEGLEFRGHGRSAEDGSVGVLRWDCGRGSFAFVEPAWLRTITRDNWEHR